jgi:CheY-like chemotaxis protein
VKRVVLVEWIPAVGRTSWLPASGCKLRSGLQLVGIVSWSCKLLGVRPGKTLSGVFWPICALVPVVLSFPSVRYALPATRFQMNTCTLLHVEDEDSDAYLLRAALDQAGISTSVYRVCDGKNALAFLSRSEPYQNARRPELVVLDLNLNLPGINGWTVLSEMQTNGDLSAIPVVILSTSSLPEDKERAYALGAKRYIVKPYNFDVMMRSHNRFAANFYISAGMTGPDLFVNCGRLGANFSSGHCYRLECSRRWSHVMRRRARQPT